MKSSRHLIRSSLSAIAMLLALLVILSGVLAWSPAATCGLTVIMFAAVFGARSAALRGSRHI